MQAPPRLSLIGPPLTPGALSTTLSHHKDPGFQRGVGRRSVGSRVQTSGQVSHPAGSYVPGASSRCASSNPHLHLGHPRTSASSPGTSVPETTSEGRGCRLPLPLTRRRQGNPRLRMVPELWQETLCRHHRPSPGSPGTQANSKGTRSGRGRAVGKQLFSTNLFSPTFLKSNSTNYLSTGSTCK